MMKNNCGILGADINAKNNGVETPFYKTAINGHKELAELLIKSGADVNAKDKYRRKPLKLAKEQKKQYVFKLLLSRVVKQVTKMPLSNYNTKLL